jgi:hypothetical protein
MDEYARSLTGTKLMKLRYIGWTIIVLTLSFPFILAYWRYPGSDYPYGRSHCCDKQLWFALKNYAHDHSGVFPSGGSTPEASLSLLYPQYADANLLRGRTVTLDRVQKNLDSSGQLDPQSCGWYYVEGLQNDDDQDLALFWDKIGLGHNGERLSVAGHTVFFIGGYSQFITEENWDKFQVDQKMRRAARKRS